MDVDVVAEAIREAEAATIAPRFRALESGDVDHKGPDDPVTVADRDCEAMLGAALRSIDDLPIVGEEAATADPSLLAATANDAWIVDPLDGTKNFANGWGGYEVMVARVVAGTATHAWVWVPQRGQMAIAERGAGTEIDGEPVTAPIGEADTTLWTAVVKKRYVPVEDRPVVDRFAECIGDPVEGIGCAGIEYIDLVLGRYDLLMYWRTLPWDHVPGALLATEAGLDAVRPDGRSYMPGDDHMGLLVGAHARAAADRIVAI
ncbi:MAG: inositol monophosphatase family protein [Actinomycetota bacterium]